MHMKRILLASLILATGFILLYGFNFKKIPPMKDNTYQTQWNQVYDFEKKSLPQSALKVVQEIYNQAKQDKNHAQLIKSIIFKIKLQSSYQEEELIKTLLDFQQEITIADYPVKPILHSMLAEMYWNYYEQNRYRFLNRTETVDFKPDDIRTWDLKKLVEKVIEHYQASLAQPEKTQLIDIADFDPILYMTSYGYYDETYIYQPDVKARKRRPTVYDFLAHRAVDFFMNQEAGLTKPLEEFTLANPSYLSSVNEFAKLSITTPDSMNYKFRALSILQNLIRFHMQDEEPEALVDVDLKRLAFVYTQSTDSEKEKLYMQALVELQQKYSAHTVSAQVGHLIASIFYGRGSQYNPLQPDYFKEIPEYLKTHIDQFKSSVIGKTYLTEKEIYKWDLYIAYHLCNDIIKKFPESDGAQNARSLQSSIQTKSLSMEIEQTNLPGQSFRALLEYKNVNKVYVRIIKTSYEEIEAIEKKIKTDYDDYNDSKHTVDLYTKKPVVQTYSVELPVDGDFQLHRVEIKIPQLPLGQYVVFVSPNSEFSYKENAVAYAFTTISAISYIHRTKSDHSMDFTLLHRDTGLPLAGASIQVWEKVYNYKKSKYEVRKGESFKSNVDGYFSIPQHTKDYRSFNLEIKYGEDRLKTSANSLYDYSNYAFYQNEYYPNESNYRQVSTYFFTDRAIYRPGQTVYFKGIRLEKMNKDENWKISKDKTEHVEFYDANYQKIAELNIEINDYGTFSGSFVTPMGALNGQMHIQDGYGTVYFSVEEYKRPKFEVKFEDIKGTFKLGETVSVKGNAKAYAGSNIDDAKVQYRVVRNARFPYWWYCWRGYYPSSPQVEIANGVVQTNENGEFEIKFLAKPDASITKESQPTFTYTVYADVTDQNGETRSSSKYVSIGYTALLVKVEMPEQLNRTEEHEFQIKTTNLEYQHEPAKGTITVHRLKNPVKAFRDRLWTRPDFFVMKREEFYKEFPYDVYDNESDYYQWEKEKEVLSFSFNSEKDSILKVADLKKWAQGKYVLEIKSKDKYGEEVKEVSYFTVYDPAEKTLPYPSLSWIVPMKTYVEPGDKATILIGSSAENTKLIYEWEHKQKITHKEWLSISNSQQLKQIPIQEDHRGNLAVHVAFIKHGRLFTHSSTISVPYTNKELDIAFETFRDKLLPGEKEQWKIKIKGKQGDKVAAEMVATLYDASLDAFRPNNWSFNILNYSYETLGWSSSYGFEWRQATLYQEDWNKYIYGVSYSYDYLNWFGSRMNTYDRDYFIPSSGMQETSMLSNKTLGESKTKDSPKLKLDEEVAAAPPVEKEERDLDGISQREKKSGYSTNDQPPLQVRTNFNETAFFYPHLETNAEGEVVISFTIPESLTRWKMLGFAHTKDLKFGMIQNQLITQKDLMITANAPRFFREGDQMSFTAKVSNISDKELSGTAQLELFDATTMQPVASILKSKSTQSFEAKKGQSAGISWDIEIPDGIAAITYRVIAKAGHFSDGEEMAVPVLTNRMLVTESLPLPIRSKQTKNFTLDKLVHNKSTTLRNHKLTLEFTSNPAWYAVQALPYLMEYPYECAEQTFSRFYANSLASHIANSNPKIKRVFDAWKNAQPDALLSNLEKNQELKSLLLEETPWVHEAKSETERKRRIALLFDLNKMADELERAIKKLKKMQYSNGAWGWFDGMPEDRYMTQHIVTGMGHLDHLGVKSVVENDKVFSMIKPAMYYLDRQVEKDYQELKRLAKAGKIDLDDNHLWNLHIHYLYARSFFKDKIELSSDCKEAFDYFKGQAQKYWLDNGRYLQGMIALALQRYGDLKTPKAIVASIREHALNSEEMGMYWKAADGYWFYWYQAPIETQALMIELFDEVANDQKAVDDLKVWLLKQKQTQDWKTTKATTEACYALLLKGTDWLASDDMVEIIVGSQKIDPKTMPDLKIEAGTGYLKTSWSGSDIKSEMGNVTITKKDEGVSWGALYWQYFEQLDRITLHETPLKLKKQLFLQKNSSTGPVITPIEDRTELHVGDLVKVRIELRVDRDMEYVHMKDMRAASFEPTNVFSQYKWQDGLGYYESTRDAATNFFFSYLRKGTYVFEYPLRVTHKGDFSNGVTTIQCMYAPEFTSHSEGIRVKIK